VSTEKAISEALKSVFSGIRLLRSTFPGKQFTVDGRFVGDIGEVMAARDYDVQLYGVQVRGYDGHTSDGRLVQVKATFKNHLTFRFVPDYYLGFRLYEDGTYDEIYNGPGTLIYENYRHRKGIGEQLLSFPIGALRVLSARVSPADRIPARDRIGTQA
jgi:hypothetical protein